MATAITLGLRAEGGVRFHTFILQYVLISITIFQEGVQQRFRNIKQHMTKEL